MHYAGVWLAICIGILGLAGLIARGRSPRRSTSAEPIEEDDPDHNHGSWF